MYILDWEKMSDRLGKMEAIKFCFSAAFNNRTILVIFENQKQHSVDHLISDQMYPRQLICIRLGYDE